MGNRVKKVLVVAGESSGDLHAANLIREVKQHNPDIYFAGMGGQRMKEAGADIFVDITKQSATGFFEILHLLPKIYFIFKTMKKKILKGTFDLIILIDYPTFNLRLAKIAKKAGLKVLYYISPQIWAWHQSRVDHIRQNVDVMAVILPFEVDFYRRQGVSVKFVGHPFADRVVRSMSIERAKQHFHITSPKIVGLLPGSRKNEIKYLLPDIIDATLFLKKHYPDIEFVLPLANTLTPEMIAPYLKKDIPIKVITENHYDAIGMCDAVIAVSGTITLETALLGVPMVIIYKGSFLSYHIAKKLVKIPLIGLCNVVAGKKVVEELIQDDANGNNIANEIIRIYEDKDYRVQQKENLQMTNQKLKAKKDSSIGELVLDVLQI